MSKRGRYYLGRVIKLGPLDDSMLLRAFTHPAVVEKGKYAWTITNAEIHHSRRVVEYAYGQISKFDPKGLVKVINRRSRRQEERLQPDMAIASCPFVYVPKYSGIAYLHVWNQIERDTFTRRFQDIVEESHQRFFFKCSIESISDMKAFSHRVASLDHVSSIDARVFPPNPLFGPVWRKLMEYLEKRNASELKIHEESEENEHLNSKILDHVNGVIRQTNDRPYEPEGVEISDAAILMAADGYGRGTVEGHKNGSRIVISTFETVRSFLFSKEPDPRELFDEASKHMESITKERRMRHDE